jgi:hypothetical protein
VVGVVAVFVVGLRVVMGGKLPEREPKVTSTATVIVPAAGVDVGLSRTIAPNLRWLVGLGPEVALIRQRFLVNGVVTADLQRLRFVIATGLAIDL